MSPLVAVIATGGTIASSRGADGAKPSLRGEDLLAGLPALPVRLRPVELLAKDSSALTLADMQGIVDAVRGQLQDPDIAGVVILHGTDAMEETSLLAHLQLAQGKPVVFTGAQFTSDHPDADGPGNLTDAIRAVLAGAPGVRIVFGGRNLPAWGAYKFSSDSADAFRGLGEPKLAGALPAPVSARVDIVAIHPGGDGLHLRASLQAGADGIVLAALGSGNATADVVAAVRDAGVPVVVSSRVPEGVLAPAYGGGGGGHDLALAGAVHSRLLRPGQARILLAALIANGAPIAEAFA
ncbi:asparaginase domain-containing protein [Falsirhodobacter xinxiangensis]|uniref:asparaginase domain-containing protein n=1 Tax=Falsirhodobacter xinxiangensis TaxID=2530049 RepID=UPI0010A9DEBD|nr:asparaginase domain-containing protein [Rhodobacter xinxiangensis]